MAKKHTFPGVYVDSGAGRFLIGGVQEPLPPHVVVPPATNFTISGQVTESSVGKEAVTLTFSSAGSATTDGTGNYAKTVPRNWIGSVTPVAISGGTFVPTLRSYAAVVSNWTTQDFVYNGTGGFGPQPFRTIEGSIAHEISETPIVGHPVTFTQDGPVTDVSDGNGRFQFIGGYAAGTLVPAPISTGTWTPTQTLVPADQADHTTYAFLFYGTGGHGPQPAPYMVSGTVRDWSNYYGYPEYWDGWLIEWNYGSTETDTQGRYSILVAPGFTGTVAFTGDGWGTTTPAAYALSNVQADQPDKDFDYYGPEFTVGGTIWDNYADAPWSNQTVNITGWGPTDIALTTDADGKYSIQAPWNIVATIAPLITGEGSLSPVSQYNLNGLDYYTDYSQLNFQYWYNPGPVYLNLEGYVYDGLTLVPLSDILIDVSDVGPVSTDANGYWSQSVIAGYTGRATAIDMSGTFDPEAHGYTDLGTSASGQDFYFYLPAAPTDCPVPGANIAPVSMSPDIASASRNAVDSTQHLLWFIDESGPNVGYYDITYGTIAGYVDTQPEGQWGNSGIVYDPVSNKIAVTGYFAEKLTVIDPVSKTVVATLPGPRETGFHMLTVADNGTIFASSNRWVAPSPNATIYGYDLTVPCVANVRSQTVYTDSICWAPNISRLVINSGGFGQPRFYLYDPVTGSMQASVSVNTTTFNYENGYVPQTGHLLLGFGSGQPVIAMDIANGTDATVVHTFAGAPTRLSDFTIDTCHDRLFISDGNYAIYEYTLDGLYTLVNVFDNGGLGVNPTGLAHSRKSNLVYYNNYGDLTINSVQATTQGTNPAQAVWSVVQQDAPATFSGSPSSTAIEITRVGNETNMFDSSTVELQAAIINLTGSPYGIQLSSLFDVAVDDQGTIDANSSATYNISGGAANDNLTWNFNGSYADSFSAFGTIGLGYNLITLQATANLGGNFGALPCTTYSHIRGTWQFIALG